MPTEQDKKQNLSLQPKEEQLIEEHKHLFINLLMVFYQLDCTKVLEIPLEHNGEKFK